jgi:hypothetical protein
MDERSEDPMFVFVPHGQAAEVVEPRERAFDLPSSLVPP